MSYRNFLDAENRRWEVWLVLPTAAERRKRDRRVATASRPASYKGQERRKVHPAGLTHFTAVPLYSQALSTVGSVSKARREKNAA